MPLATPNLFAPPAKAQAPAIAALRANRDRLGNRDRETADSLLQQARSGGLTAKQCALASALVERVNAPPLPASDGLGAIVDILAGAGRKLKWPVIRFEAEGIRFRLGLAGPAAREPGSVNVTSDDRRFEVRTYFGRIDLTGVYHPHHRIAPEAAAAIGAALQAFAAAPAKQARIYGQRFGHCCFCGLELTDGRSIDAGYGPVCAEKFGLPWGN